jgi:hypothetical protein
VVIVVAVVLVLVIGRWVGGFGLWCRCADEEETRRTRLARQRVRRPCTTHVFSHWDPIHFGTQRRHRLPLSHTSRCRTDERQKDKRGTKSPQGIGSTSTTYPGVDDPGDQRLTTCSQLRSPRLLICRIPLRIIVIFVLLVLLFGLVHPPLVLHDTASTQQRRQFQ